MKQGDVYWCHFPVPIGRRPAIVLTRDDLVRRLTTVTLVPITRSRRGIRSRVQLGPADGLPAPCEAGLDSVYTVPQSLIENYITHLSPERMREVAEALDFALGLPALRGD